MFSGKSEEDITAFAQGCSIALESMKDVVDDEFCMLSAFGIQRKNFKGIVSEEDVKKWVEDNKCYEWGRDWKDDHSQQKLR